MPDPFRLVLDTNTLLSGLANRNSASGRALDHCVSRRVLVQIQVQYLLTF